MVTFYNNPCVFFVLSYIFMVFLFVCEPSYTTNDHAFVLNIISFMMDRYLQHHQKCITRGVYGGLALLIIAYEDLYFACS
jgi:hypothetical protein